MKRRTFYIFLSGAALTLLVQTAPAQSPTYLLDGKPIPAQLYQAALLMNQGIELDNANRPIEAKQKLTEAVRIAPDFPDAHYNLGVVLLRLKEEALAEKHFEFVVVSRANFPLAWLALGQILLSQGKHREAVDAFVDALNRYPEQTWRDKPDFYHNYGVALAKLGEIDKGIEQMKLALDAKTDLPELWASLGSLYQGSGRLDDAIAHYREFTRRFPNRPEAIIIVDLIKALEGEIALVKSHGAAAAKENAGKDYYAAITRNGAKLWPAKKMPLKVHIQSGDAIAGFEPRYAEILKTAFDEWSKASQGKVTFKFVDNGAGADIRCSWTSDPSQLKNRAERGETLFLADRTGVMQAVRVVILTVPTIELHGVSDNQMRFISLHEVGHALGLTGHSLNPADIMFVGETPADIKRDLSERDRQTLLRLYAPPNASSGSSLPKPKPHPR